MTVTILSSKEFEQYPDKAQNAAHHGPVYITDQGRATHVLLSIGRYKQVSNRGRSIVDILSMEGGEDIEFEPPHLTVLTQPI